MSRPTVGWLRVTAFPDRVRQTDAEDVTAVLPNPPKNGQYPAWVSVLCSFLVAIDYLVIGIVVVVLVFVLSVNGVALPDGRAGLVTLLGLAVVVRVADVVLSGWRSSPLDAVVRWVLRPVHDVIRDRLVTVEMVSQRAIAATARPTPVAGSVSGTDTVDPSETEVSRWGNNGVVFHEAKVLRTLRDHEHVVTLYDSGYDPHPRVALEYVEGGTIRDQLPVLLPVALDVVLSVAEALEYAHGNDISHTDLKPENILYSEEYFGRLVLVTDWGKRPVVNPDLESMLSRPYAAPEQFDALPTNEPEAELIDVYQPRMLACELFTGTQPFLAANDIKQRVRSEVPPPPSTRVSELPAELDDVILTAIAKNPTERYQSVAAFRSPLFDVVLPDITPGESTT